MSVGTFAAVVTTVRDGDSFATSTNGETRLANVCAPEKNKSGFQLAKERLEALILRRSVSIVPVARDTFGRTVADVYVNGVHVNARMRSHGYTC